MIKTEDRSRSKAAATVPVAGGAARLPYTIELWGSGRAAERVLGRADTIGLARVIFQAAQAEHPGRRVVLRRGRDILQDSG